MTKTVWLFDDNNEYTEPYEAQESPLEPGVFIIPIKCLTIKPPITGKHEVSVAENGVWVVYPDFRGIPLYDKNNGTVYYTKRRGEVSSNYTVSKPDIFQKWDEKEQCWVKDIAAQQAYDKQQVIIEKIESMAVKELMQDGVLNQDGTINRQGGL